MGSGRWPRRAEHTGAGPVLCIADNHPAHRAKAVDRYVASTDGALRPYRLPAYSPQLLSLIHI